MSKKINKKDLTTDELLYLRAKGTYYTGSPIMSDSDFDTLELKLSKQDSFVVDIVGSLRETKTGFTINKGKTSVVKHDIAMGSLDKVKFLTDYVPYNEFKNKFLNRVTDNIDIEVSPKLDGNAGSIKYVDGKLVHIASRGDGIEGQDYTKLPLNVPRYIKDFTGEIRGEFVIDRHLFEEKYGKNSDLEKKFVNARNFVAGSLNKGEKNRVEDIDFIAFRIENFKGDTINQLRSFGFQTLSFTKHVNRNELTQKKFEELYTEFDNYRKRCKYQLDGFVFKFNESVRDILGKNNHHPYWAIAAKFIPEEVSTTIIDIEWALGKRGQMSPVAILEPVELMGSIVRRASLYNASWMLDNKCYPGAVVTLVKSGDIIPVIVSVITEAPTQAFVLPNTYNGNELTFDGVNLIMDDFENTDEYKEMMMYHTISALGIKNIGPAKSARIAKSGLTIIDLFKMSPDDIAKHLVYNGDFTPGRELELLINSLLDVNEIELWQVIYSFGYRNCGRTISKQLANFMTSIKYDFKGLESTVVEAFINSGARQNEVNELVNALKQANVTIKMPEEINADVVTFEMSGTPTTGETKGRYKIRMEQTNKALKTGLKKDTDYLVVDNLNSTTTKVKKAQKYGVKIVTYDEFEKLILK